MQSGLRLKRREALRVKRSILYDARLKRFVGNACAHAKAADSGPRTAALSARWEYAAIFSPNSDNTLLGTPASARPFPAALPIKGDA